MRANGVIVNTEPPEVVASWDEGVITLTTPGGIFSWDTCSGTGTFTAGGPA